MHVFDVILIDLNTTEIKKSPPVNTFITYTKILFITKEAHEWVQSNLSSGHTTPVILHS